MKMRHKTILTLNHYHNVQVTHLNSTVTALYQKLSAAVLSIENEYLSETTCVRELKLLTIVTSDKTKECLQF